MPAKGWKRNADGVSVGPDHPSNPDNLGTAMLDLPVPGVDSYVTVDSAAPREGDTPGRVALTEVAEPDGMTKADAEDLARFVLPEWDKPADGTCEEVTAYWCGAFEGGPRSCYSLGGVAFPLYTENPGPYNTPRPQRTRVKGCIQNLTPRQVERIKHMAATLVVRQKGEGKGARRIVINADPAHFGIDSQTGRRVREYVRQQNDTPVGCFVFLVEFTPDLGPNWQKTEPSRLIPFPPTAG